MTAPEGNLSAKIKRFLFENVSVRQSIAKNTFWLSVSEIAGRVLRAGIVIYAARALGAAGLGIFSYAASLSALFAIFSDLGVGAVITREGTKGEEERVRYFSTALVIKLVLTAVSALAIVAGLTFSSRIPISKPLILFTVLLFTFDALRGFATSLIRSTEKMQHEAVINVVTQLAVLAAGFAFLLRSETPASLAAAYAVGSAAGLIAAIYLIRTYFKKLIAGFDRELLWHILKIALPMSVGGILGAVMINTDTILLGWFRTAEEVGFYSAAQKPILLLYIIPAFIGGGIFPALARFAGSADDRFRKILEKGLTAIFLMALPLTAGMYLISRELTLLLFSAEYFPAIAPMKILSLTILTTYPMVLIANAIFAYNKQRALVTYGLLGAVSNAILDLALIPHWGIEGSAFATLGTQLVMNTYLWFVMRRINKFSVLPALTKIMIATAIMSVITLALKWQEFSLFVLVPAAILVYFGTLLILRERLFRDLKSAL